MQNGRERWTKDSFTPWYSDKASVLAISWFRPVMNIVRINHVNDLHYAMYLTPIGNTLLKHTTQEPYKEMNIASVTSIKIFFNTMTNNLSVSLHVRDVISSCAHTLYAIRVMRAHGMNDSALQAVYESVVAAKLL